MKRRLAREIALQTLFQFDFSDIAKEEALLAVCYERGVDETEEDLQYTKALIDGVLENKVAIDEAIIKYANNWKLERMASVDRNILRVAIYEMFYAVNPLTTNIIINEAIEISKIFGNDYSSKFINGILGNMANERL